MQIQKPFHRDQIFSPTLFWLKKQQKKTKFLQMTNNNIQSFYTYKLTAVAAA